MVTAGAVFLLTLAVAAFVLQPLLAGPRHGGGRLPGAGAELLLLRDQLFHDIREAEFDYRVGKLSEADYMESVARLKAEAAEIIDRIDRLNEAADAGAQREPRRSVGDIEARVAAARVRTKQPSEASAESNRTCPACTTTSPAEAQFCMKCGAQLAAHTKDAQ